MENEVWLPVIDYPDYEVSNLGNMRSLFASNKRGKFLRKIPLPSKTYVNKRTGYACVGIGGYLRYNKKRLFLVHRLVAISFIPNVYNKAFINHKNGVKIDNRAENLEWVTREENMQHLYRELGMVSPACRKVKNTTTGEVFNKITDAANSVGIRLSRLSIQLSGKIKNKTPFVYHE